MPWLMVGPLLVIRPTPLYRSCNSSRPALRPRTIQVLSERPPAKKRTPSGSKVRKSNSASSLETDPGNRLRHKAGAAGLPRAWAQVDFGPCFPECGEWFSQRSQVDLGSWSSSLTWALWFCVPGFSPGRLKPLKAKSNHGGPAEHAAQVQGLHALGHAKGDTR